MSKKQQQLSDQEELNVTLIEIEEFIEAEIQRSEKSIKNRQLDGCPIDYQRGYKEALTELKIRFFSGHRWHD